MKRFLILITCVLCISAMAQAVEWQKYVSKSKEYSFHYPKGWKVEEQDSIVAATNPAAADEQLLLISLNAKENETPRQVADNAIAMMKQGIPDIKGSLWREGEDSVALHITMTSEGKPNEGDALVIKKGTSAFWFSYTNLKSAYNDVRSLALARGFAGSMAAGDDSQPPKAEPAPAKLTPEVKARLEKDANAFIFLLEFGLGTPFTASQEKLILDELRAGWPHMTPEDIAMQDTTPGLVAQVMKVDQQNMETLRKSLEAKMREWLDEVDQSDPAVKMVKNQLNASSKILVNGDPPLPEVAATAYAEMMVFSSMLKKNINASPSQIPAQQVAEYKAKIAKAWNALDGDAKSDGLSMPGMWMTIRQVLRAGTPAEQKSARASLAKVQGASQTASTASSAKSSGSKGKGSTSSQLTKNFIAHQTVMMMKQQTFNTYMWSRGYQGWTPMGKMW